MMIHSWLPTIQATKVNAFVALFVSFILIRGDKIEKSGAAVEGKTLRLCCYYAKYEFLRCNWLNNGNIIEITETMRQLITQNNVSCLGEVRMINTITETWDYNNDLEMLYLSYQVSDELLSEFTPDTYSLPLHNSMTLLNEIEEIYFTLQKFNTVKDYYANYISVIIDEFLNPIESDYLLKRLLGGRLTNIRTG